MESERERQLQPHAKSGMADSPSGGKEPGGKAREERMPVVGAWTEHHSLPPGEHESRQNVQAHHRCLHVQSIRPPESVTDMIRRALIMY